MKNWLLLLASIALFVTPLLYFANDSSAEFSGTDDKVETAVNEIQKDYSPWLRPFWSPPSKEIESSLFALQASLGTGVIAFGFGWLAGKKNAGKL